MDNLIASLCTYFSLLSYNSNSAACQAAVNSSFIQSGIKTDYSLVEHYYSKIGEGLIRDNINDKILYSVIGAYFVNDTIIKKEIKLQTKCNVFLCNSLNFDLTQGIQSYSMDWKWEF